MSASPPPEVPTPRRPARANRAWWAAILFWVAAVAVTAGAVRLHFQWGRTWDGRGAMTSFHGLTPFGRWAVSLSVLALWTYGAMRIARATGRRRAAWVGSALLVGASLVVAWGATASRLWYVRWTEQDRLETAQGNVFVTLSRIDLIDLEVALGRVADPGVLTETIDVLDAGELYAGHSGYVLMPEGTVAPARTSLAALPSGGVAILERERGTEAVGVLLAHDAGGQRRHVGLFELFDADDTGDPRDVERWCAWLAECDIRAERVGDDALRAALDHPSPWVRDAAQRLLDAHTRAE